jgi:formylglycine-generating enzyme required for sulfatase activity
VCQLIGNTWEWTDSEFAAVDREGRQVVGDTLLKVIRGGAYDTYFPWQAASAFRSGLGCLSRAHNVGFRCTLDLLDDR